jgi:hypothetical protein
VLSCALSVRTQNNKSPVQASGFWFITALLFTLVSLCQFRHRDIYYIMPSTTRARSPSPSAPSKKPRTESSRLAAGPAISLPADNDVPVLAEQYQKSDPYKHISVPSLFDDEVLQGVVSESRTYGTRHEEGSLPGWGWEHKETDIYKVSRKEKARRKAKY